MMAKHRKGEKVCLKMIYVGSACTHFNLLYSLKLGCTSEMSKII